MASIFKFLIYVLNSSERKWILHCSHPWLPLFFSLCLQANLAQCCHAAEGTLSRRLVSSEDVSQGHQLAWRLKCSFGTRNSPRLIGMSYLLILTLICMICLMICIKHIAKKKICQRHVEKKTRGPKWCHLGQVTKVLIPNLLAVSNSPRNAIQ